MIRTNATLRVLIGALFVAACASSPEGDHGETADDGHEQEDSPVHEEGVVEIGSEMLRRMELRTAPVSTRVLPVQLETTGQVDFEQNRVAHVTPRIPGRVEKVQADLGDRVTKGQVLVIIDSIEFGRAKSEYLQARAQAELARQNFEREEGLFAERISSEKEMLAAKSADLEAVARLRNTEEVLRLHGLTDDAIQALSYDDRQASLLPVRAPLAGRIVEKHVSIGELITPDRAMFTVADLDHVWIWIDVYERDLGNVHLEDDVAVTVEAYPDTIFRGEVTYVSDQVDSHSRTIRARIDVENSEQKLRPGMFARVVLSDPHGAASELAASLVVPEGALQRDGNRFIVFVRVSDHRFARHEVQVGRKADGFIEIQSGLDPADIVVVAGAFLLRSEASKAEMGGGHDH